MVREGVLYLLPGVCQWRRQQEYQSPVCHSSLAFIVNALSATCCPSARSHFSTPTTSTSESENLGASALRSNTSFSRNLFDSTGVSGNSDTRLRRSAIMVSLRTRWWSAGSTYDVSFVMRLKRVTSTRICPVKLKTPSLWLWSICRFVAMRIIKSYLRPSAFDGRSLFRPHSMYSTLHFVVHGIIIEKPPSCPFWTRELYWYP